MKKPEIPNNESQRQATLSTLNVLDTPAEERFDRITRVAQQHFKVSIALVSLVDEDRQWFKSRQGLDATETPRDISFCGHAILSEDIFYIPNTLEDSRFADNPLVTSPPNIRFYAGAPLHALDGKRVGTLCIIDDKPREFSAEELTVLRDLADGVESELERTHLLENEQALQHSEERLQHLIKGSHGVIYACKAFDDFGATFISANSENILGYSPQDFIENSAFWLEHVHPDDREPMLKDLDKLFELGDYTHEYRFLHADGCYRWMHDKLHLIRDGSGNPLEIVGLWTDITERRESENKTKQLAMVAERTDNAVIITNAEGLIEWVNQGFERISGYTLPEVIGKNPGALLQGPDTDPATVALMSEKVRKGEAFNVEVLNYHKNGNSYWLALDIQPVPGDDGVAHFIAIESDITERKIVSDELSRFKHVLDNTLDMIFMFDSNNLQFNYLNKGAVRSMGYSKDELLQMHPYDIKPEISKNEFLQLIEPLLAGRTGVLNFETTHRRKDGGDIPVAITLQLVRESAGSERFIAVVHDITERKAHEKRLLDAEQRIRAVIDTVVDGIVTIDTQGIVQSFNPAAEDIFGYTAEMVIDQNVKILMPESYANEHDGYLHNYLTTGEKKVIGSGREVTGQRKDGSTFPMELAVSEMLINGERMFTGIVRDITERKKIESMKSEFISTVSHELRTPLTSIRGALGLVLGRSADQLSDKARNMLEMANRNSERLTLLINDILDLEKIESGRLEFEFATVDLVSLARRAIEDNEGYAQGHQVKLQLDTTLDSASVWGDEHRLLQVFANLISNAVKYSPEDGEVGVSVTSHEGGYRVAVRDHGQGIPEEFRTRMFQRFAQADSSDTREKGGTGLGLSITKAIVESHMGQIGYESELGKGTVFHFDLPSAQKNVKENHQDAAGIRVLICEDNVNVAEILAEMLRSKGVVSDIATTVEAARTLLDKHTYRLLLLDLTLPDADGLQYLQELRAAPATAELPVIVVSGRAEEGRMSFKGDAVTVVDWLQKPIDWARLERALHEALQRKERPHILHVEDDLDIVQVTQALLEEMAEVSHVPSLVEARQRLATQEFDLVILDLGLTDGSGLDLLDELKGRCPVVIFSAQIPDWEISAQVTAALTKSMTSNEQLLATIMQVLEG